MSRVELPVRAIPPQPSTPARPQLVALGSSRSGTERRPHLRPVAPQEAARLAIWRFHLQATRCTPLLAQLPAPYPQQLRQRQPSLGMRLRLRGHPVCPPGVRRQEAMRPRVPQGLPRGCMPVPAPGKTWRLWRGRGWPLLRPQRPTGPRGMGSSQRPWETGSLKETVSCRGASVTMSDFATCSAAAFMMIERHSRGGLPHRRPSWMTKNKLTQLLPPLRRLCNLLDHQPQPPRLLPLLHPAAGLSRTEAFAHPCPLQHARPSRAVRRLLAPPLKPKWLSAPSYLHVRFLRTLVGPTCI